MSISEKIKGWFNKNKKYVIAGGTVVLTVVGTGIGYVLFKNKKVSFPEWLKMASTEELREVYEELRQEFCKTGYKPAGMEQISHELGDRGAKEWFAKHPPNLDPNFRWTDANRWDRD